MPPFGSTRNLTQQFIRLRNEARRLQGIGATGPQTDKATERLISAALGNSSDVEAATSTSQAATPVWVRQAEFIREQMNTVKERISKLKEYHAKALLVTFGQKENDAQTHVEVLTREVQQSFKQLDAAIRAMAQAPGQGEDKAVREQVQRQLAQALFKLSVEFRKEETRFLQRVEQNKGLEEGSTLGFVEADEPQKTGADAVDPGFTTTQLAMVDIQADVIKERDEEIQKIVQTISELAQIMRDLSTLVIEQGTLLDRIDHNIAQTEVKVEDGVKQLKAAEKTQKRSGMMMCIVALICIIVLLLLITIIRHA